MKVAFTTDVYWPRINGVTVSTNIFLNELRSRGHQMRLWAPEYPSKQDRDAPHQHDPEVARLKSFGLWFSKEDRLPRPWKKKEFFQQLDAFAPDLIHVQTEFILSLMVRAYAKKRPVPVIQTCHTYFERYIAFYFPKLPSRWTEAFARWLTRRLFRTADAIIAPTESMKKVLESYGIDCPITVVPTGFPASDFAGIDKTTELKSSAWLERYPDWKGKRILLYAGRVAQEKNLDFLLDVLESVREKDPHAIMVVAGNGPYLEAFRKLVVHRHLNDFVTCLGYVDRSELLRLYALADVFTFASVTETQGLVTIEAMMCGTPAVAVGRMGTKEVMNGDNGGFMVEPVVTEFAGAVTKLLGDPALYQAKAQEAKLYSQKWSASQMAQRLEDLYVSVKARFDAKES